MNPLIGREKEQKELRRLQQSIKSEFVAMYGRRRARTKPLSRNVTE